MQNEILLVAESVSGEKGLSKDIIFEAIESALATATKRRYSEPSNILVNIDQSTGEYVHHQSNLFRRPGAKSGVIPSWRSAQDDGQHSGAIYPWHSHG